MRFYPGRQSEPYDAHSDTYSRDTSIYDRSRDTNRERTESRDHIRSQSRDHSFDIKLERVTDTKPIVKLERRNSPNRNSFVTTQTRDQKTRFESKADRKPVKVSKSYFKVSVTDKERSCKSFSTSPRRPTAPRTSYKWKWLWTLEKERQSKT